MNDSAYEVHYDAVRNDATKYNHYNHSMNYFNTITMLEKNLQDYQPKTPKTTLQIMQTKKGYNQKSIPKKEPTALSIRPRNVELPACSRVGFRSPPTEVV